MEMEMEMEMPDRGRAGATARLAFASESEFHPRSGEALAAGTCGPSRTAAGTKDGRLN
jgi:hypothetical protein